MSNSSPHKVVSAAHRNQRGILSVSPNEMVLPFASSSEAKYNSALANSSEQAEPPTDPGLRAVKRTTSSKVDAQIPANFRQLAQQESLETALPKPDSEMSEPTLRPSGSNLASTDATEIGIQDSQQVRARILEAAATSQTQTDRPEAAARLEALQGKPKKKFLIFHLGLITILNLSLLSATAAASLVLITVQQLETRMAQEHNKASNSQSQMSH